MAHVDERCQPAACRRPHIAYCLFEAPDVWSSPPRPTAHPRAASKLTRHIDCTRPRFASQTARFKAGRGFAPDRAVLKSRRDTFACARVTDSSSSTHRPLCITMHNGDNVAIVANDGGPARRHGLPFRPDAGGQGSSGAQGGAGGHSRRRRSASQTRCGKRDVQTSTAKACAISSAGVESQVPAAIRA